MAPASSSYRPRKFKKQLPFLVAFDKYGSIRTAARSVRISPDAVYDWRRRDPQFAIAFDRIKSALVDEQTSLIDGATTLLAESIRTLIPEDLWPRVYVNLARGITRLKAGDVRSIVPSRKRAGKPSTEGNGRHADPFFVDGYPAQHFC